MLILEALVGPEPSSTVAPTIDLQGECVGDLGDSVSMGPEYLDSILRHEQRRGIAGHNGLRRRDWTRRRMSNRRRELL
jgi:hypothetical protein